MWLRKSICTLCNKVRVCWLPNKQVPIPRKIIQRCWSNDAQIIFLFFEGPNIKSKILTMVSILIFCSFQFLLSKRCDPSLPGGPQVTNWIHFSSKSALAPKKRFFRQQIQSTLWQADQQARYVQRRSISSHCTLDKAHY